MKSEIQFQIANINPLEEMKNSWDIVITETAEEEDTKDEAH